MFTLLDEFDLNEFLNQTKEPLELKKNSVNFSATIEANIFQSQQRVMNYNRQVEGKLSRIDSLKLRLMYLDAIDGMMSSFLDGPYLSLNNGRESVSVHKGSASLDSKMMTMPLGKLRSLLEAEQSNVCRIQSEIANLDKNNKLVRSFIKQNQISKGLR